MGAATADPADDAVRLVYADWLEEQPGAAATAQAQFVRLQVERARLPLTDPRRAELLAAEDALARPHRRHWNGRLHRRIATLGMPGKVDARRGAVRGWAYHRGMVGHVTVDAAALPVLAGHVAALGPVEWLTVVGVGDWFAPGDVGLVAAALPAVRVLSLRGEPGWQAGQPDPFRPWPWLAVLDLRATAGGGHPAALYAGAIRAGGLPRVIVCRRAGSITGEVQAVDPFARWGTLRPLFAALTGDDIPTAVYQGANR